MRTPPRLANVAITTVATTTLLSACTAPRDDAPLMVFAASSTAAALKETARAFKLETGDSIQLVFGATGDLAAQIRAGAPADLFLGADTVTVSSLAASGHIIDSTRVVYAKGVLVLVAYCSPKSVVACERPSLNQMATSSVSSVSIANPVHAPYGKAAQQTIERAGIANKVGPKLIIAANIDQATQNVASGNSDYGLVAQSSARQRAGNHLLIAEVDSTLYDPLLHAGAIVSGSANTARAVSFMRFLNSETATQIFTTNGFRIVNAALPQ